MDVTRLVQVWAPGLGRASSGHLLGDRLVLTAWHATSDGSRDDGDALEIRLFDPSAAGAEAAGAWVRARRVWPSAAPDMVAHPGRDVALLEIVDEDASGASTRRQVRSRSQDRPVRFGRLDCADPVPCRAVGFPRSEQRPDGARATKDIEGRTEPNTELGAGLVVFTVTNSAPERDGAWSGGSGAALYCGDLIVGVLVEDRGGYGGAQLRAANLAELAEKTDLADVLRAAGVDARFEPIRSAAAAPRTQRHMIGSIPPEAGCFQERGASGALETALTDGSTAVLCQVLSGAGGVGKTQVAARFARDRWERGAVDVLLWLTASDRAAVVAQYAQAAGLVGAPARGEPDADARAFVAWLASTDRPWLIVLDDVAEPGDLRDLWPPKHPSGRTVVTTRRRDAALSASGRRLVEVEEFTPAEAAAYVAAKLAERGRGGGRSREDGDAHEQIAGLAGDLGYLPVALAQAVAYLLDAGLTCARYRARWADRRRTLLRLVPDDGSLPDDQRTGLAAVWSLSVQRANALEPAGVAGPLLAMAAVLDPNGIPPEVLTSESAVEFLARERDQGDDSDETEPVDAEDARDALAVLARLSLCNWDPVAAAALVRIHAVLQRATREANDAELSARAVAAAADGLLSIWPDIPRDPALMLTLRGNARTLAEHGTQALWQDGLHSVLFRAGRSLNEAGLAAEAIEYFSALSHTAEGRLGPDHPSTLTVHANLATAYNTAGELSRAAALFEALLAACERVLGSDHPHTFIARNNLAGVIESLGDAGRAIGLYETAIAGQTLLLGADHPDTLASRMNLAGALRRTGNLDRAIALYEVILADAESALGPDHPRALTSRVNLANAYSVAGDQARAISMSKAVLAGRLRVLGPDHPDTLGSRSVLAAMYGTAGDSDQAVSMHEAVLADRLRVLGPDHPDTLRTRMELAVLLGSIGDPVRGASALESAFDDLLRVLGPDHSDTLKARSHLADLYRVAGNTEQAVRTSEAVLTDQTRIFGPDHPDVLARRVSLARAHAARGDVERAVALLESVLADCERVLGPNHPHTLGARNDLASAYRAAADYARAIPLAQAVLADLLRVFGPDSPDILTVKSNLAAIYTEAGEPDAALPLLEEVLDDSIRMLSPDHPHTLTFRNNLATAHHTAGDLAGAIPLYSALLDDCVRILGVSHHLTATVRQNLESSLAESRRRLDPR